MAEIFNIWNFLSQSDKRFFICSVIGCIIIEFILAILVIKFDPVLSDFEEETEDIEKEDML